MKEFIENLSWPAATTLCIGSICGCIALCVICDCLAKLLKHSRRIFHERLLAKMNNDSKMALQESHQKFRQQYPQLPAAMVNEMVRRVKSGD